MKTIELEELLEHIETAKEAQDYQLLKEELSDLHPADLAEAFDELPSEESAVLFRLLPKDQAAEVFSYMGTQQKKDIAHAMQTGFVNHIFDELNFDDKIDFLEEMPANFVKALLASVPKEERGLINQFLNYPENSAGSLMTIEYVNLNKDITVGEALQQIKRTGMNKETVYTCYVLDGSRRLEGTVSLRLLVLSDEDQKISDIMDEAAVKVEVTDDQEEVAEVFRKYGFMALPVVDSENRMIGIITIDDIVDVIEQENTEDFQRMAAMEPSDEEYLETGVFTLARHRIVWLLVLMLSATFTGNIMSHYEALLSAAVILTNSVPMLMDSGGNAGSQSSTLIIRGLALGEIEMKDWYRVMWKEFRVSFVVGIALMIVNMIRMALLTPTPLDVNVTVSITLACTIMLAKLVGSILPIGAKALKLDPAIMAGPLITTIVDAACLIIYFNIASQILSL